MNNAAIAKVLQDIADLLELKGESAFKVRAYQRGARAIENLTVEAERLLKEGRLRQVPGVGQSLAEKIQELITTGRCQYYEDLRAEFPDGVTALMDVPGIGPRTAARLAKELGIAGLEELEDALLSGQVATLPRMGEKTAENILRHLQAFRRKDQRISIGEALPVVEEIIAALSKQPGVSNLTPAGSLRRFRETVGDIDLMGTASAEDAESIIKAFVELPQVKDVLVKGPQKASVIVHGDLQVDLRLLDEENFGSLLQYFTGSKDHNIALRERALRQGLSLSEYGITNVKTGEIEKYPKEEDFYRRLGLQYIPPELREARGEIELAERGLLPTLIELSDIKGDLHAHTEWSDGRDSIEEMALAAKARGYEYIAITDHSSGRGIAHGLNGERLREQIREIREIDERLEGIHIFAGIEVDIRSDGTLDLPDELLAELDVVVASVHSAMGQDEARMTQRIVRALQNPHVDILGHPTCRLLGQREPVAVDMEAVFRAAAAMDTALEINSWPYRLDLKDLHVFRARELGVKVVIGTDSHKTEHLDVMRFGVGVARRGWCEAQDILNTRPLAEMEAFLRRDR